MRVLGVALMLASATLAHASVAQGNETPGTGGATPAPSAAPAPSSSGSAAATPATAPAKQTPAAQQTPPASAGSAATENGAAAEATGNAPPEAGKPPLYYVEPGEEAPEQIYEPEPPPYVYEPPPPPRLSPLAPPRTAFWAGVRLGALIPFGSLWVDGFNGYYRQRTFRDYASTGPVFELDVGGRVARHYNVFALWQHASLGTGALDDSSFGGQERGATNLYGVGVRFSTDPTGIGFLMEIGLGYRDFRAYWNDGTKLSLTDGWLDAHIGVGADIRLTRWFSLSPMIVLGGGSFGTARWSGPAGGGDALTSFDENGEYGTLTLELGAHADVF